MEEKKVSPEEVKRLKGLGFLRDKRYGDRFNVRVVTGNGKISSVKARAIADAADRFGSGEVAMTTRQTQEIQCVPYENVDALREYLAQYGLETGGTGPKVRPVVSCKGTTCTFGLIDTYGLSEKIHVRFYQGMHDVKLPHKFKIAVGGCPNNCVKPELNDVGIIGQRYPSVDTDQCRGCNVCQVAMACPVKAASAVSGKLVIDEDACNHCGRCAGKCPFGAHTVGEAGYRIWVGGRWGKKTAVGRPLHRFFTSEEEVLDMIEKLITVYRENGQEGERFAETIDRIGFETLEKLLGIE